MKNKVLIVDDDVTLARFLSEFFVEDGFQTVTALNGAEALRQAYKEHPDIVILDVMMPGMDGWEVCARLREMSRIPIILLTGKTTEADKLRGFRLGIDDYVTKPFSFAELAARVRAVLARSQTEEQLEQNELVFGDLVVDLAKKQARRGADVISLTPTEYRLLEHLANHKGRAISEAELAQQVWGNYREEDTNAVRRYIWLLRQKIEINPAHPRLILTVRGFGYRMGSGQLPGND
jgi:DNA-binding response OmpR family regulator